MLSPGSGSRSSCQQMCSEGVGGGLREGGGGAVRQQYGRSTPAGFTDEFSGEEACSPNPY